MQVKRYTPGLRKAWNDFLPNAKNATFLFNRDFMEYHADRYEDYSLVLVDDSENILALFPANIFKNKVISHEGLTYGGMIVTKYENTVNSLLYLTEFLKHLHSNNIDILIYKEIPFFYNEVPSDEQQYGFFLLEAKLIRRDVLTTIKSQVKRPFQRRRMRSIRNAQRLGVEIKEEHNFEVFWQNVLIPNLSTKYNTRPVHTAGEIRKLCDKFPNNIRHFNAYLDGKIMAGATIFEMPRVAHAQYSAGTDEGKKNGSLDVLFCTLISEVFAGKEFFSFGNSNEDDGQKLNMGLLEWKEGFGGSTFSQNFYEIETRRYNILEKMFLTTVRLMIFWFTCMKSLILNGINDANVQLMYQAFPNI